MTKLALALLLLLPAPSALAAEAWDCQFGAHGGRGSSRSVRFGSKAVIRPRSAQWLFLTQSGHPSQEVNAFKRTV